MFRLPVAIIYCARRWQHDPNFVCVLGTLGNVRELPAHLDIHDTVKWELIPCQWRTRRDNDFPHGGYVGLTAPGAPLQGRITFGTMLGCVAGCGLLPKEKCVTAPCAVGLRECPGVMLAIVIVARMGGTCAVGLTIRPILALILKMMPLATRAVSCRSRTFLITRPIRLSTVTVSCVAACICLTLNGSASFAIHVCLSFQVLLRYRWLIELLHAVGVVHLVRVIGDTIVDTLRPSNKWPKACIIRRI